MKTNDGWQTSASTSVMFACLFSDFNPAVANFNKFITPTIIKFYWRITSIILVLLTPLICWGLYELAAFALGITNVPAIEAQNWEITKQNVETGIRAFNLALINADKAFAEKSDVATSLAELRNESSIVGITYTRAANTGAIRIMGPDYKVVEALTSINGIEVGRGVADGKEL